jgi:phage protein U
MMSLGGFVFSLSEGTPYKGLQRTSDVNNLGQLTINLRALAHQ